MLILAMPLPLRRLPSPCCPCPIPLTRCCCTLPSSISAALPYQPHSCLHPSRPPLCPSLSLPSEMLPSEDRLPSEDGTPPCAAPLYCHPCTAPPMLYALSSADHAGLHPAERVVEQEWCLMERPTLHQAPLLPYTTPAHAVRDMHYVSNYPSTPEEPVRFGSFGRRPSGPRTKSINKTNPATCFRQPG